MRHIMIWMKKLNKRTVNSNLKQSPDNYRVIISTSNYMVCRAITD